MDVEQRVTALEVRERGLQHQLDEIKPIVAEIHHLSNVIVELTSNIKTTNEDIKDLKDDVSTLKKAPLETYTHVKRTIVSCVISTLVGCVLGAIIKFM